MKIIFEAADLVSHGTGGLCTRPADLVRFLKYPEKAAFLLRGCSREEQLMAAETARNILNDFLKDHPEIKPESHYDIIKLRQGDPRFLSGGGIAALLWSNFS